METAEVIDYAYPAMMAERALKELHEAALNKEWYTARNQALQAISWLAETYAALVVMQEKDKGR